MNDLLQKYGIPVGIVVASIVAIYFYGKSQYDKGKNDLRTELLLQPAKVETVKTVDTIKTIIRVRGEARGEPQFIKVPVDSCCDQVIPYIVQVKDSNVSGEIICKPESQSAAWDLSVRPCLNTVQTIYSSKYISEEYSFWATPLAGYNKDGVLVGGMIGFKSIGIGVLQQEKPTWIIGWHKDF